MQMSKFPHSPIKILYVFASAWHFWGKQQRIEGSGILWSMGSQRVRYEEQLNQTLNSLRTEPLITKVLNQFLGSWMSLPSPLFPLVRERVLENITILNWLPFKWASPGVICWRDYTSTCLPSSFLICVSILNIILSFHSFFAFILHVWHQSDWKNEFYLLRFSVELQPNVQIPKIVFLSSLLSHTLTIIVSRRTKSWVDVFLPCSVLLVSW